MKKAIKKSLSLVLSAILLVCALTPCALAGDDGNNLVSLRIEGAKAHISTKQYSVSPSDVSTIKDLIEFADTEDSELTITIAEGAVTAVNDIIAKTVTGTDGWHIMTNDTLVANDDLSTAVSDGDDIVLFYGDLAGAGMMFPNADFSSLLDKGEIAFTYSYSETDATTGEVTTVTAPIVGATVTWGYFKGYDSITCVTDKDGIAKIDLSYVTMGDCYYQIEKYSANGLPLVLRYEPKTAYDVEGTINSAYRAIQFSLAQLISAFYKMQFDSILNSFNAFWNTFKAILASVFLG